MDDKCLIVVLGRNEVEAIAYRLPIASLTVVTYRSLQKNYSTGAIEESTA